MKLNVNVQLPSLMITVQCMVVLNSLFRMGNGLFILVEEARY